MLGNILLNPITIRIIIGLLKIAKDRTDNTVDDAIVKVVEEAFLGKKP